MAHRLWAIEFDDAIVIFADNGEVKGDLENGIIFESILSWESTKMT